jgi:hypothetical protein
MPSRLQRGNRNNPSTWGENGDGTLPGTCPPGTSRMVFLGLLGPDATSVTYQAADGSLTRERTSGGVGAYLIVVPLTQKTCNLYFQRPTGGATGPCGNSVGGGGSDSASPGPFGPIRAITYRDGHSCKLTPPKEMLASYTAFIRRMMPPQTPGRARPISPTERAKLLRAIASFAAARHLSVTELITKLRGLCPAVGYVAPHMKRLTAAEVASPITVGPVRKIPQDTGATISFIARQAVTSSDSWYEFATTGPARCEADSNGPIGYGDIRVGQRLTARIGVSYNCRGTVHGNVGYMQHSGPTDAESAGSAGTPGKDGSIIVGHFKLTIR